MKQGTLSDAQFQERLRQADRRRERQRKDDLRTLMSTDWGRRVAHWLVFDLAGLTASSFDVGAAIKDGVAAAMHIARAEGARDMGLRLYAELQDLAPLKVLEMMGEQVQAGLEDLAMRTEPTESANQSSEDAIT